MGITLILKLFISFVATRFYTASVVFGHPPLAGEVAGLARRRGVALSIELHPSSHLVMARSISVQKPIPLQPGKSHSPSRLREGRSGSGNPPDWPKQRGALFTPIGGWASVTVEKSHLPIPDTPTSRPVAIPNQPPSNVGFSLVYPERCASPPPAPRRPSPPPAPVASVARSWRVAVASVSRRRDVAMAFPLQFGPIRPKIGPCNGVYFPL
ncbi:hypothetical protein J2W40_003258 [Sphingobium xenophagum]|uniref:Uncharacterized protein n=1 Tax=Sphingobium xenophagum TaxID=121428 RepID=A0ABU1X4A6_SPHXE|nr:hypothetical protein [Sphingobium xenophagum]